MAIQINWDEILNPNFPPLFGLPSSRTSESLSVANADGTFTVYTGSGFNTSGSPSTGTIDAVYLFALDGTGTDSILLSQISNVNIGFGDLGTAATQMALINAEFDSAWLDQIDQTGDANTVEDPSGTLVAVQNLDGTYTVFGGTGLAVRNGALTGNVTGIALFADLNPLTVPTQIIDIQTVLGVTSVSFDIAAGAALDGRDSIALWNLINSGDNTVTIYNTSADGLSVNGFTPASYTHGILDGAGSDTLIDATATGASASFVAMGGAIFANLTAGFVREADGSVDSLVNVHALAGSNFDDVISAVGVAYSVNLDGREGNDFLAGGGNNDSIFGDDGQDVISGNGGADVLFGEAGNDTLNGGDGDDKLLGGVGQDVIDGGAGRDLVSYDETETPSGVNVSLAVTSFQNTGGGGFDQLLNIEDLEGSSFGDTLAGGTGANFLRGLGGADSLNGGLGADTFVGGAGNDTIVGDNSDGLTDTIDYSVETRLVNGDGGSFGIRVNQNGGSAQDGIAADTAIDSFGDTDTIHNIRNIIGTRFGDAIYGGANANNLSGLEGNDTLFGGDGVDTLTGGAGDDVLYGFDGVFNVSLGTNSSDILTGGDGNDTYYLDASGLDVVSELANVGSGTDEIRTQRNSASLVTYANVENLTFVGSGDFFGTGSAGANVLSSSTGNDTLDGAAGADTMAGDLGSDTYIVDNTSDVIIENSNGGFDFVKSSVTFDLSARAQNVEQLELTGALAINGTGSNGNESILGNAAANLLRGLAGNDFLFGGAGNDTLEGGAGNDIYIVDSTADMVNELSGVGSGTDTVRSTAAYTLTLNVENLELQGTGNINGTGNALNNSIVGNAGNNFLTGSGGSDTLNGMAGNDTLDGGTGVDFMTGGTGNDFYMFDNVNDAAIEFSGGGNDTIQTSVGTRITGVGNYIETIQMTATGVGNIFGGANANTMIGSNSNNVIDGFLGNDTLTGGAGADTFVFDTGLSATTNATYNLDRITDFTVGVDKISLENTDLTPGNLTDRFFTAIASTGALSASEFRLSTAADTGQHIIYNAANGALLYDPDGNGIGSPIQFAQLTAGLLLTANDFIVT